MGWYKPQTDLSRVVAWTDEGLAVTDMDLLERLVPKHLSPSAAQAMGSCPARRLADKALPYQRQVFGANTLGTASHLVFERFYQLPPTKRTKKRLLELLDEAVAKGEIDATPEQISQFLADPDQRADFLRRTRPMVEGLWKIEKPRDVQIVGTEMGLRPPGYVSRDPKEAYLAGAVFGEVPVWGSIDRVDLVDDVWRVVDYKTGKPKEANAFGDPHGDQLRVYRGAYHAALLAAGKNVSADIDEVIPMGHIFYTAASVDRRIDFSPQAQTATQNWYTQIFQDCSTAVETGVFECKTSGLCGWCPLVKACPAASAANRAEDRAGTAIAPDILRIGDLGEREPVNIKPSKPARSNTTSLKAVSTPTQPTATVQEEPMSAAKQTIDRVSRSGPSARAHLSVVSDSTEPIVRASFNLKAWDPAVDPKGRVNTNSYAVIAAFGLVDLAVDTLTALTKNLGPTAPRTVMSKSRVTALAQVFAQVVDLAQMQLFGRVNREDSSHTRLRGALRTALETLPVPLFTGDTEALNAWRVAILRRIKAMSVIAFDLVVDGDEGQAATSAEPWQILSSPVAAPTNAKAA